MRTEYPWTSIIFRYGQSHQPGLSCSLTGKGHFLVAGRQALLHLITKAILKIRTRPSLYFLLKPPVKKDELSQFFFFYSFFIFYLFIFFFSLLPSCYFVLAMGTGL